MSDDGPAPGSEFSREESLAITQEEVAKRMGISVEELRRDIEKNRLEREEGMRTGRFHRRPGVTGNMAAFRMLLTSRCDLTQPEASRVLAALPFPMVEIRTNFHDSRPVWALTVWSRGLPEVSFDLSEKPTLDEWLAMAAEVREMFPDYQPWGEIPR